MATTQEKKEAGGGLQVEFEENGETQVVEINNIDELFRFRLSQKRGPRVSLIRTRQLMASSKVSGTTLKWIAKVIPRDVVADSLEVSASNLSKLYQRKSLSRTQTEGLEDLTHLWKDVLQDLFSGDEQMMRRWLDTPVPALDGETPKKLMGTLTGRKVLDGYIQKLKYGDYS